MSISFAGQVLTRVKENRENRNIIAKTKNIYVDQKGDTMTGHLVIPNAVLDNHPITKKQFSTSLTNEISKSQQQIYTKFKELFDTDEEENLIIKKSLVIKKEAKFEKNVEFDAVTNLRNNYINFSKELSIVASSTTKNYRLKFDLFSQGITVTSVSLIHPLFNIVTQSKIPSFIYNFTTALSADKKEYFINFSIHLPGTKANQAYTVIVFGILYIGGREFADTNISFSELTVHKSDIDEDD